MDKDRAYVELSFCPSPELIPIVRRFVAAFYERLLTRADVAARLALATHELLENTVKFTIDGISSIHLELARRKDATEISIRTRNRSSEADSGSAIAIVDEMRAAPDLFAYYQDVMRKNARRADGSGLGLARICAEAEMVLDCGLDGDELILIARTRVPADQLAGGGRKVPDVSGPNFAASSAFEGGSLTVRLSGNADLAANSVLEQLLPRIHSEALRAATREVTIDFTGLEFMNSSCFRSFVTWLSDVQDLPPDRQYRIRLVSNAARLWQRRSLHALKYFAHGLVSIEG